MLVERGKEEQGEMRDSPERNWHGAEKIVTKYLRVH